MSIAYKQQPLMTVAEFLKWPGDGTGARYELVDGILRLQDPASDAHGTIQTNLSLVIGVHLRAKRPRCRIVTNPGIAPRLHTNWNYREPDLGVTCAPNRPDVHMMPDPILLIEIISPSNSADTWSNIALYATVPTVTEILIVDSTKVAVEVLRRQADGNWPPEPEAYGAGSSVGLASIELEVPLVEVYRDTYLAGSA